MRLGLSQPGCTRALTQQACPSVYSLHMGLLVSPLPPGMLGLQAAPKGCVQLARPRESPAGCEGCCVLPASPSALQSTSVPAQQGKGWFPSAKGTPKLEQSHWSGSHSDSGAFKRQAVQLSPCSVRQVHQLLPAPVCIASWLQPCPVLSEGQPWGVYRSAHMEVQVVGGDLGTSLPLPHTPSESPQPGIQQPGQQRPWRAEVVCAGSAPLPPLPKPSLLWVSGLPEWPMVPPLLVHHGKAAGYEAPRCCLNWSRDEMARAQHPDTSNLAGCPQAPDRRKALGQGCPQAPHRPHASLSPQPV